jgi:hypothetical protein
VFGFKRYLTLAGFYSKLGSPRMSVLMKEEYNRCSLVKNSTVAEEIRSLVLERLPLFLHEHNHSSLRHSYGWLSAPNNFIVQSFQELHVTKSLNHQGKKKSSPKQVASAVAEKKPKDGPIELSLAEGLTVDKYE